VLLGVLKVQASVASEPFLRSLATPLTIAICLGLLSPELYPSEFT
jgi:hypothetical protein